MPQVPFKRDVDLIPLGAVWRVQPVIDADDFSGETIPDLALVVSAPMWGPWYVVRWWRRPPATG